MKIRDVLGLLIMFLPALYMLAKQTQMGLDSWKLRARILHPEPTAHLATAGATHLASRLSSMAAHTKSTTMGLMPIYY